MNNGYASSNIFTGMRVKKSKNAADDGRNAFSTEQLQLMFLHLTDASSPIVRKDVHKWPALISMFTGMRLNEVAQLEISDIELDTEVPCINVTPDGDNKKRLKNDASKRRVPIHEKLVAAGFVDFYEAQKRAGNVRLFPELTYSAQNGYGRNAGRWFNEKFLPQLGLGSQGLVFHCFRHTMSTRLAQADVPSPLISAILGHAQSGMTMSTYFKAGYRPEQLREALNHFDF